MMLRILHSWATAPREGKPTSALAGGESDRVGGRTLGGEGEAKGERSLFCSVSEMQSKTARRRY